MPYLRTPFQANAAGCRVYLGRERLTPPVVTHKFGIDPVHLAWMVKKAGSLNAHEAAEQDPIRLVRMVNQVAQLTQGRTSAS
jgi:hypothetical protein